MISVENYKGKIWIIQKLLLLNASFCNSDCFQEKRRSSFLVSKMLIICNKYIHDVIFGGDVTCNFYTGGNPKIECTSKLRS